MNNCINRRKPVPERTDRGGTLRYAWLRAPPLHRMQKITSKPRSGCLTQKPSYEGWAKRSVPTLHIAIRSWNGARAGLPTLCMPRLRPLELERDAQLGAVGFDFAAGVQLQIQLHDLGDAQTNAHLTRYDTAHGKFPGTVTVEGDNMIVNGDVIRVDGVEDALA